jgi:pimeloyl-ACP methyl ester carboxylesterase
LTETTGRAIAHLEITEINEMPETFVLIHGAWHTGEDFEPIANILRDAGHTVYCPTLRGNRPEDDRSKLGLEDAISSGVEFIEVSDLTDIRLVGHSYAGMVISGVADRLEKRPRRLVYINAFVPLKGQSLNDMVMPDYAAAFAAIAEANNGAILLPFEIWRENFINDADIALARSTYDRLNPQPYRTFTDKISLQRPLSELSIGKSYINCQQDIALPHSYPWHPRLSERLGYSDLWRCPEVTRPSFQIELDSLKQSGKPPETNASPEKEYFGPTKTTFSMILYKPMPAIMMPRTSKTQPVRKTSATKSASPLALSGSEAK